MFVHNLLRATPLVSCKYPPFYICNTVRATIIVWYVANLIWDCELASTTMCLLPETNTSMFIVNNYICANTQGGLICREQDGTQIATGPYVFTAPVTTFYITSNSPLPYQNCSLMP